ncbi:MAG: hypothetical protein IKQ71_07230 [Lachnospiraceae bacterium]|nr:hypothetical protein [Lachnospiraceae bacterium]
MNGNTINELVKHLVDSLPLYREIESPVRYIKSSDNRDDISRIYEESGEYAYSETRNDFERRIYCGNI